MLWSAVFRFSPGETGTGCRRGLYVCKQGKSSESQGIVAICRVVIGRHRCSVDPRNSDMQQDVLSVALRLCREGIAVPSHCTRCRSGVDRRLAAGSTVVVGGEDMRCRSRTLQAIFSTVVRSYCGRMSCQVVARGFRSDVVLGRQGEVEAVEHVYRPATGTGSHPHAAGTLTRGLARVATEMHAASAPERTLRRQRVAVCRRVFSFKCAYCRPAGCEHDVWSRVGAWKRARDGRLEVGEWPEWVMWTRSRASQPPLSPAYPGSGKAVRPKASRQSETRQL